MLPAAHLVSILGVILTAGGAFAACLCGAMMGYQWFSYADRPRLGIIALGVYFLVSFAIVARLFFLTSAL